MSGRRTRSSVAAAAAAAAAAQSSSSEDEAPPPTPCPIVSPLSPPPTVEMVDMAEAGADYYEDEADTEIQMVPCVPEPSVAPTPGPRAPSPQPGTSAAARADLAAAQAAEAEDSQLNSQLSQLMVTGQSGQASGQNDEEFGDMHQLVLQGVMAAGYMDAKGVKRLFQESSRYLKREMPQEIYPYIQKTVREINERIKEFDMMIRSATCEISGEKFYVFLVTIEKPVMKMQTYFTKPELDLLQQILDTILWKRSNFLVGPTECINMEVDFRGFTKVNAENFLDRMIKMKYLTKVYRHNDKKKPEIDREYDVTVGFRTIREFEPILKDVYGDIFGHCCLCKMILLNGLQCPKCPAVIHRACIKKYLKDCNNCVGCNMIWENDRVLVTRTLDSARAYGDEGRNVEEGSGSEDEGDEQEQEQVEGVAVEGSEEFVDEEHVRTMEIDTEMPHLEPVMSPQRPVRSRGRRAKNVQSTAPVPVPRRVSKRKAAQEEQQQEESDSGSGSGSGSDSETE